MSTTNVGHPFWEWRTQFMAERGREPTRTEAWSAGAASTHAADMASALRSLIEHTEDLIRAEWPEPMLADMFRKFDYARKALVNSQGSTMKHHGTFQSKRWGTVRVLLGHYVSATGPLAVALELETGEPLATLSVNMHEPDGSVKLTPLRLAWLQKLKDFGPTEWADMPSNSIGARASKAMVWGALTAAGFIIEADGAFAITDTGRAVLEKALRVVANQEGNDRA